VDLARNHRPTKAHGRLPTTNHTEKNALEELVKLLIASDIHGAAEWCRKLMDAIDDVQPDKVVLLGDLLYHGPRNDVPPDYAPKQVIPLLNSLSDRVVAVRGNCEAEVDQMVLDFPCMGDYALLVDDSGRQLFLTHGHLYGEAPDGSPVGRGLPNLPDGSAFVSGHTHVKVNRASSSRPGLWLFNPGSVGIPKDGTHSYGIYEKGAFELREL
jgi:putative phosphoesterase